MTSNLPGFHLNDDMVSRRIYELSFYGEHSITKGFQFSMSGLSPSPTRYGLVVVLTWYLVDV